ncbi:MAG: hypothetical protein AAF657_09085 [Acidobacteriota bacterium]
MRHTSSYRALFAWPLHVQRCSVWLGLIGLACLLPPTASAAELSLMAGYRFGGPDLQIPSFACIYICPEPVEEQVDARDGEAFGLILDVPLRDQLMFEVLISHQEGEFDVDDFLAFEIFPTPQQTHFDLTYLHVGVLRQWQQSKVTPFAAVGFGVAQLEADQPPFFFGTIDEDRLSASLAGGVKVKLWKWLGLRLEGRGYWTDMPESVGKDLVQFELSSGLTFKL